MSLKKPLRKPPATAKGKSPRPRQSKPVTPRTPGAGKGGVKPPEDGRFKPGPDPRRGKGATAGAILKCCINGFYRRKTRNGTLRRLMADQTKPEHVRQAAQTILHARRDTTLADFEPFLRGTKSLKQLADAGVDLSVVKSASIHDGGKGKKKHRRIELHDDAGENLDRIIEQTDGRPKQTTEIKADVILRTPADRTLAATEAATRLRKVLQPFGN